MNLSTLRRELRQQRRQLPPQAQLRASECMTRVLTGHNWFRNAKRIGFYLANDGEIDPTEAMAIAAAAGKSCYLPVLHPLKYNRLYFVKHRPGNTLVNNRYGIAEPPLKNHGIAPCWSLNLLLLPLVGFDRSGHRLGMGGGYYDRTLAFKRHWPDRRPKLLGLAHSLQEVENIPAQPWDIPLDGIVTEQELLTF